MRATTLQDTAYTHVHWAFATVTAGYNLTVNDSYSQWQAFKSLSSAKKVVSIGGWGFSTDPTTYDIMRRAVKPENLATFATNVAAFVQREGLDGIDVDWEVRYQHAKNMI